MYITLVTYIASNTTLLVGFQAIEVTGRPLVKGHLNPHSFSKCGVEMVKVSKALGGLSGSESSDDKYITQ